MTEASCQKQHLKSKIFKEVLTVGYRSPHGSPELEVIRMRAQHVVGASLHIQAPVVDRTFSVVHMFTNMFIEQ